MNSMLHKIEKAVATHFMCEYSFYHQYTCVNTHSICDSIGEDMEHSRDSFNQFENDIYYTHFQLAMHYLVFFHVSTFLIIVFVVGEIQFMCVSNIMHNVDLIG